jgi:hypothetical protein
VSKPLDQQGRFYETVQFIQLAGIVLVRVLTEISLLGRRKAAGWNEEEHCSIFGSNVTANQRVFASSPHD